jgi:class 3 adenylate cyclase
MEASLSFAAWSMRCAARSRCRAAWSSATPDCRPSRIEFRVGVHLGDVVEESDGDLMGEGVNIAARLQGVADPGAICLSEQAYWQVKAENSGRRGTTPQSSAAARGSARTTQLYDRRRKRSASTS